jgi:NAD(P)-dependent dehydrogenase (short-subunit alcohol dehydrogenase family)
MSELLGQWAVVTGGSKGIGQGIATDLAERGANLLLVARDRVALKEAAGEIAARSGDTEVRTRSVDLAIPAEIDDLFAWMATELPHLNIMVANAGFGRNAPLLDLQLEQWQAFLDLNLTAAFLCIQGAARRMVQQPQANMSIVAISSIRSTGVRPGRTAYAVSKAGLNQLVRAAAGELAPHHIRVNAVSPGVTDTPLVREYADIIAEMVKDIPMGRVGTPADVSAAVGFLCSPKAEFITGANLVVDGGEGLA